MVFPCCKTETRFGFCFFLKNHPCASCVSPAERDAIRPDSIGWFRREVTDYTARFGTGGRDAIRDARHVVCTALIDIDRQRLK